MTLEHFIDRVKIVNALLGTLVPFVEYQIFQMFQMSILTTLLITLIEVGARYSLYLYYFG